MIVTGRTVGRTIAPIAKAALDKAGIAYEHYSEVSANPTVTVVDEIQKNTLRPAAADSSQSAAALLWMLPRVQPQELCIRTPL